MVVVLVEFLIQQIEDRDFHHRLVEVSRAILDDLGLPPPPVFLDSGISRPDQRCPVPARQGSDIDSCGLPLHCLEYR